MSSAGIGRAVADRDRRCPMYPDSTADTGFVRDWRTLRVACLMPGTFICRNEESPLPAPVARPLSRIRLPLDEFSQYEQPLSNATAFGGREGAEYTLRTAKPQPLRDLEPSSRRTAVSSDGDTTFA